MLFPKIVSEHAKILVTFEMLFFLETSFGRAILYLIYPHQHIYLISCYKFNTVAHIQVYFPKAKTLDGHSFT